MTPPPDQPIEATVEQRPVAYLYENEEGSRELILDCNGEYARRLLEFGYTETPVFTRPPVVDGQLRIASRAIHEHLSRRDIMQYLDNDEDCEGIARAVLTALSLRPAPETTAPDDVVEKIARIAWPDEDNEPFGTKHTIRVALANLPKPTEQATSPAPDAVLRELRSAVFDVLRRHDVSEQCFAEVAMVTHAAPASSKTGCEGDSAVERCPKCSGTHPSFTGCDGPYAPSKPMPHEPYA